MAKDKRDDEPPRPEDATMDAGPSDDFDQTVAAEPRDWNPELRDGEDGRVIGNFKILHRLGEGGMGDVYLADQTEPIQRKVAFKIIKKGMENKQLIQRFQSERQALAMMNHENIAKVFDAGTTDNGRPFFVMEYVDGTPITDFCDEHDFNTRQRLDLFVSVCEGVQHAHQKAIIHRDLKPSNVLVGMKDNQAVAKIIDFGIAKALAEPIVDDSAETTFGQLVGTPSYMSPEQADLGGADIDTRTDVYSLGVMLYQLLAGTLPHDPEAFRGIGFTELRRIIQEETPPRPSTRITELLESGTTDLLRGVHIPTLIRDLRGDLDWIIMTAIDKDRARRYASASDFALDIQRYINNEPVLARPPSRSYRTRKFVKRHKVGVLAGSVVFLAVLLGIAGTTVGMVRAQRAERLASQEAETSRQVSDFLVGLFKVSDPDEARGNSITAREILDEGAKRLEVDLKDQPTMQARMMSTIGKVYQSLGLYPQAEELLQQSLDLRHASLGPEHSETAASMGELGALLKDEGQYPRAESLLTQSLVLREVALGENALEVAALLNDLGITQSRTGNYEVAESLFVRSLGIRETALGTSDPKVAETLANLSVVYWNEGQYDKAEDRGSRALSIRESVLGESHPQVARSLNNLALVHHDQGHYDEAIPLYQRALKIYEETLGEEHPHVALGLNNLAWTYYGKGDLEKAGPLYARALVIQEATLGKDHPDVARTLNNLANLNKELGRYQKAEPQYRRALEIRRATLGENHPDVGWSLGDLGILYREEGQLDRADSLFSLALSVFESSQDGYGIAWTLNDMAVVRTHQGEFAKADTLYQQAIETFQTAVSPTHPELAEFWVNYANLLNKMGRFPEAREASKQARAVNSQ